MGGGSLCVRGLNDRGSYIAVTRALSKSRRWAYRWTGQNREGSGVIGREIRYLISSFYCLSL